MKNYYEILEVDIHASSEVIDKAFKVLAKKYHPDMQEDESKKEWAEEQFKQLNEAYEILSDKVKREEYTKELEFDKNGEMEALMLKNADLELQVEDLKIELENLKRSSINHYNVQPSYQGQINTQSFYQTEESPNATIKEQNYQQEPVYYESYYHPIKSRFKSFIAFCITFLVILFIGFLIWKIPYTHNLIENNPMIQSILKLFHK